MKNMDLQLVLPVLGMGVFLWMGLFMISRTSTRSSLTIACFIGMLAQAYFFFHTVLVNIVAEGKDFDLWIHRVGWWSNVLPLAFWFHISSLVVRRGPRRHLLTPTVITVYLWGGIVILAGTFTDLILNFNGATVFSDGRIFVGTGTYYPVYITFVAVTGVGAFINLANYYRRISRVTNAFLNSLKFHIQLLTAGGLLFLVGGLFLALKLQLNWEIPNYLGYTLLVAGLALCSYSVVNFEMLVAGKHAQRDFLYSFSGVFLINLIYAILLVAVGVRSIVPLMTVVVLVTVTHTMFDSGRNLLDRIFFSQTVREARQEARSFALDLATQPAPTTEIHVTAEPLSQVKKTNEGDDWANLKLFNDAVRRSISGLKSPPQLVKSPLLTLLLVENRLAQEQLADNRLNRATVLKSILTERIEHLRPPGGQAFGTSDAWRFFNVLYFPYIREISKKQAYPEARRLSEERRKIGVTEPGEIEKSLEWLSDVDEDTFYKWQRRASDLIAATLQEDEAALKQSAVQAD